MAVPELVDVLHCSRMLEPRSSTGSTNVNALLHSSSDVDNEAATALAGGVLLTRLVHLSHCGAPFILASGQYSSGSAPLGLKTKR